MWREVVVQILQRHQGEMLSPTEIGVEAGLHPLDASGRMAPVLKKLVAEGLVKREAHGPRMVRYGWKA